MRRLVVVTAPWCAPCKKFKEDLERLEEAYPGFKYLIYDVEHFPEIVEKYDIQSVPFLIIRDESGDIETHVGTMSIRQILEKLELTTN